MNRLRRRTDAGTTPRLVSLQRSDVAGLTVTRVDLRACRFADAHHLDQLNMGAAIDFAAAPSSRRWTTRKVLAEEHHWRAHRHPDSGWHTPAEQPPAWLDQNNGEPAQPAQLAELYRSLRKAREDGRDEPGAADFYYGEMEMRRHDPRRPLAERFVLFLYWLVSGYALRASRALSWLLGVLALATVLLATVGLERTSTTADWSFPARLGTAVLVAVEGAVFRSAEQDLTYTGRVIQIALRIAGPILLALAVISIRGRVKR